MYYFKWLIFLAPSFVVGVSLFETDDQGGLLLTPYIESNQTQTAQNLSFVRPFPDFPNIQSHAGFITTDKFTGANLFFWFIKAINNSDSAPVVLYMNGGPGNSVLFAVFDENGPFHVSSDQKLLKKNCTWINNVNVIYLDAPPGGGYSYTSFFGYSTNDAQVGNIVYQFVLQFFKLFPQYVNNEFYISGESYGGRFAVNAALAIVKNKLFSSIAVNFKGIFATSGFLDPPTMVQSADVLYENGLLNEMGYKIFKTILDVGLAILPYNQDIATIIIAPLLLFNTVGSLFAILTGYKTWINSNYPTSCQMSPEMLTFIQSDDFRDRLHIGNNTLNNGNGLLLLKLSLGRDLLSTNAKNVETLLNDGYKVGLVTGQRDLLVYPTAQRHFVTNLRWFGDGIYNASLRLQWTAEGQSELTGYLTKAFNLWEIMIIRAGHCIGYDEPCPLSDAFQKFIFDQPFPGTYLKLFKR
ncbi:hypothetical protein CHUAL_014171 [Chamberlinius hualienensis]